MQVAITEREVFMTKVKTLLLNLFKGFVCTATRSRITFGEKNKIFNKEYLGEGVSAKQKKRLRRS